MKKFILLILSILLLSGCSFEVKQLDPDEEKEIFTIDIDNEGEE